MKTIEIFCGVEIWDGKGIADHEYFCNIGGLNYFGNDSLEGLKTEISDRVECFEAIEKIKA